MAMETPRTIVAPRGVRRVDDAVRADVGVESQVTHRLCVWFRVLCVLKLKWIVRVETKEESVQGGSPSDCKRRWNNSAFPKIINECLGQGS